jgi:protein gp37
MSEHYWNEPLRWNRKAEKAGKLTKVFCASMADIMDVEAPAGQRERLWEVIDKTPYLIWQLLTKRPENFKRFLPAFKHGNVWLGVTAEDQEYYNKRWPILALECDKRNLRSWISYEPALGPLSMTDFPIWPTWIIFGGESGAHRRECQQAWLESLIAEIAEFQPHCKLFVKQFSARTPNEGKLLIPDFLKIQEFPA